MFVYRTIVGGGQFPTLAEIASGLRRRVGEVKASLRRLSRSHAFMLQEGSGELWRAAPFSAVPTSFPVRAGKRSWWGTCIWDALGILAALHRDGQVLASCGCCNLSMQLRVKGGKLQASAGVIHIAVPARHWYDDVAFT
jgi:Alkylmercury lyase